MQLLTRTYCTTGGGTPSPPPSQFFFLGTNILVDEKIVTGLPGWYILLL